MMPELVCVKRSGMLSFRTAWCLIFSLLALAGCARTPDKPTSGPQQEGQQLTIVSPHSDDIRTEFERLFQEKKKGVQIKWLDFGGTADDLQWVLSQFKGKAAGEGIGADMFFGGGAETFMQMEQAGVLQPLKSTYKLPPHLNGVPLQGKGNTWVAAALSGFGIFYNKVFATRDGLPVPVKWRDLTNPKLRDRVALADPRHSGSAHTAYEIVLQTNGWEGGWQILTGMAGNANAFQKSASDLIKDVSSGEVVFAPAIDFYARSSIAQAGGAKLGYVEPSGERVMSSDPIAILRDAPQAQLAAAFVDVVMSPEGQQLWSFKKGTPGGPRLNELFRTPSLPALYSPVSTHSLITVNPYAEKNARPYDADKAALRRVILDELLGALLIDNHNSIRQLWAKTPDAARIAFVPVSESEIAKLAANWDKDASLRESSKSKWQQAARKHFDKLLGG